MAPRGAIVKDNTPLLLLAIAATCFAQQTDNIFCNTSAAIDSFPFQLEGDTAGLPITHEDLCDPFEPSGLWFILPDVDSCYVATTTPPAPTPEISFFRTGVSILHGNSSATNPCNGLVCDEVETLLAGAASQSFSTAAGTPSYVVFKSSGGDDGAQLTATLVEIPCSGVCTEAVEITDFPSTLSGNTELTHPTTDAGVATCRFGAVAGVEYYTVAGADVCLRARVVDATYSGAVVGLYTGDCISLSCVHRSSTSPVIEWFAADGEQYTLIVSSREDGASGSYSVVVEEFECPSAPSNIACDGASAVTPDMTVEGSLILAPSLANGTQSCIRLSEIQTRVGVWYEMTGDGNCYKASPGDDVDGTLKVAVYEGGCSSMLCVADAGTPTVEFRTVEGRSYHILVSGRRFMGDFSLSFEPSDSCQDDPSESGVVEPCTLCVDGTPPDPDLMFGDESCASLTEKVERDSDQCIFLRQIGVVYCGCSKAGVTDTCNLCGKEGHVSTKLNSHLYSDLPQPICGDFVDAPAFDNERTCAFIKKLASPCGCASVSSRSDTFSFGLPTLLLIVRLFF